MSSGPEIGEVTQTYGASATLLGTEGAGVTEDSGCLLSGLGVGRRIHLHLTVEALDVSANHWVRNSASDLASKNSMRKPHAIFGTQS